MFGTRVDTKSCKIVPPHAWLKRGEMQEQVCFHETNRFRATENPNGDLAGVSVKMENIALQRSLGRDRSVYAVECTQTQHAEEERR